MELIKVEENIYKDPIKEMIIKEQINVEKHSDESDIDSKEDILDYHKRKLKQRKQLKMICDANLPKDEIKNDFKDMDAYY